VVLYGLCADISALFLAEVRELSTVCPCDSADKKSSGDLPWDGTGGIPWLCLADSLPPALTDEDVAHMWKRVQSAPSAASDALTSSERNSVLLIEADTGLFLFNKQYAAWLLRVFEDDANTMGAVLTADLKARLAKATLSISSNASVSASSVGVSAAAAAAAATAEDDWEEDGPVKGKKGANRFIKGKKVSKKSVRMASNSKDSGLGTNSSGARDVSVEALIAPYVAEERLLRLVREKCDELFRFASASGNGGDEEEAGEELTSMLQALLRSMEEDVLVVYKTVAARAKEEANQVNTRK
jgi:hypothetical protein